MWALLLGGRERFHGPEATPFLLITLWPKTASSSIVLDFGGQQKVGLGDIDSQSGTIDPEGAGLGRISSRRAVLFWAVTSAEGVSAQP